MKKTQIIIGLLLLLLFPLTGAAQYCTRIFHPHVRTLRMRYVNAETGLPMVGLPERPFLIMKEGNRSHLTDKQPSLDLSDRLIGEEGDAFGHVLEVSFDEMSHEVRQYTYSVRHLDRMWMPDQLMSSEYLNGFTRQDITEYEHSLNTARDYTHYRFRFPNEDMRLTISGNYALEIYEDGDPEKRVAVVCFSVAEPLIGIQATLRANTDIELNGRYQQLDIDLTGTQSQNPSNDFTLLVRQNGRSDNQVYAEQPTYVESNRLRYLNQRQLIFEGGGEYRHFDTYSTYFAGNGVDRIVYNNNDYHALLFADELRGTGAQQAGETVTDKCGTRYIHDFDTNGQFVVNAERTEYDDTEAEYMWVHFRLPVAAPWFDGSIYVGGDLFQNRCDHRNRMEYDNENGCYYLNTLVKQGGFDYQYWFVPKGQNITLQRTEGSHWQAQNEYCVYVYYHPFGSRYDQLIGLKVL